MVLMNPSFGQNQSSCKKRRVLSPSYRRDPFCLLARRRAALLHHLFVFGHSEQQERDPSSRLESDSSSAAENIDKDRQRSGGNLSRERGVFHITSRSRTSARLMWSGEEGGWRSHSPKRSKGWMSLSICSDRRRTNLQHRTTIRPESELRLSGDPGLHQQPAGEDGGDVLCESHLLLNFIIPVSSSAASWKCLSENKNLFRSVWDLLKSGANLKAYFMPK